MFSTTATRLTGCAAALAACLAGQPAAAKTGGAGWQTPATVSVPQGQTDLFIHTSCPSGFTATNGGFFALGQGTVANGYVLTGQGPRLDLNPPDYTQWAWNIEWPNGGAPAGSELVFNVACKKGAP